MIHTDQVEYYVRYNNKNLNRHERQAKYDLCRALGFGWEQSQKMRDWTMQHIAQISVTKIVKVNE
jgi:hypothetical protein